MITLYLENLIWETINKHKTPSKNFTTIDKILSSLNNLSPFYF